MYVTNFNWFEVMRTPKAKTVGCPFRRHRFRDMAAFVKPRSLVRVTLCREHMVRSLEIEALQHNVALSSMCIESKLMRKKALSVTGKKGLCLAATLISRSLLCILLVVASLCAVYLLLTRAPLHLVYDRLEPAGPGSVYVQGK